MAEQSFPKGMGSGYQTCLLYTSPRLVQLQLGQGMAEIEASTQPKLFYKVLGDECGTPIELSLIHISLVASMTSSTTSARRTAARARTTP